jgi:hypothetical protein
VTALHLFPKGYNANIAEGRAARADGRPMLSPYGDSAAAREWEQGWRTEDAVSDVPVIIRERVVVRPLAAERVILPSFASSKPVVAKQPSVGGGRGRPPATGRFSTRGELEEAVRAQRDIDPKIIAADVGVSLPTVVKILTT